MPEKQEGCRRAEIIPYELDAVSAAVRTCRCSRGSLLVYLLYVTAMKIYINHQEYEVAEGASLAEVLAERKLDGAGYAVAIGSKVIRRPDREVTVLSEGDDITVIKAVCGG